VTAQRLRTVACKSAVPAHGPGPHLAVSRRHEGRAAPAIVGDVAHSFGESLDAHTRATMEARFGHDFSRVQIHTGPRAAEAAQAINANAYTVGHDIVFDRGQYDPRTTKGKRLLAHELAHVVQQRHGAASGSAYAAGRVAAGRGSTMEAAADRASSAGHGGGRVDSVGQQGLAVQRQERSEEENRRFMGPGGQPLFQLHLDPQIEAQAMAFRLQHLLDPETLALTLSQMNVDSLVRTSPPPWAIPTTVPTPAPLVPRGAGPETARPAGAGDLLRAMMAVPAVDAALTNLRTSATDQLARDWRSLSTGERVAVVTQTAVIGGGALAGVASSPEARNFVLGQLQNRSLPTGVPGLNFQFNLTGPDQRLQFDLNVGALLPRSWGFR
jgi:hypothetical protein